jgi:hypothetical protein
MSAVECLACKHENKLGDQFCEACGSSLDLRFCPGCEAINGRTATHCRSCAAELPAEAVAESRADAPAEAAPEPSFRAPQRWRVIEPERSTGRRIALWTGRFFGALLLVGLGALGYHFYGPLAYHYYGQWAPTLKAVVAAPTVSVVPAAPTVAAAPLAPKVAAPPAPKVSAPPAPKVGEPTPAPASQRRVTDVKPKAAVAQGGLPGVESPAPALPAKRTVTHTQDTSVGPAAPAELKQTPPPPAAVPRGRVTHTRPGPAAAPAEPVQAAVITTTVDAPAAPAKAASAACPEAVAVLGLCSATIKGERN